MDVMKVSTVHITLGANGGLGKNVGELQPPSPLDSAIPGLVCLDP